MELNIESNRVGAEVATKVARALETRKTLLQLGSVGAEVAAQAVLETNIPSRR